MNYTSYFKKFLEANDDLERFNKNLIRDRGMELDEYLEIKKDKNPAFYIYDAFDWDKSPEGVEYWREVENEWLSSLVLKLIQNINELRKITEEKQVDDFDESEKQVNRKEVVIVKEDNVNPKHYKSKQPEPIDVIEGWQLPFHLANVIKYIARYEEKNGKEDLLKAQWYLDRYIKILEK